MTEAEATAPRVPPWTTRATLALSQASARVRVVSANTPQNLREELARLAEAWRVHGAAEPRFTYEPAAGADDLRRALEAIAIDLDARGELGAIYAARARELGDDAAISAAAGTRDLWPAARRRFARRDAFDDRADDLAAAWLAEPAPRAEEEARVRSDDEGSPRSLISRIREEIGSRRLPLRVVVRSDLASLAATGEGHVQVIAGADLSVRDVERTVLHEIEGHVVPRLCARDEPLGIFALGTARGTDDQEGRALAIERRHGYLDHARRRELALRHVAARAVEAHAEFVSTARLLLDHGAPLAQALHITARVHRGGGLAREVVYLPALLRVEAALAADPAIDRVLGVGRVSVEAAPVLAGWRRRDLHFAP